MGINEVAGYVLLLAAVWQGSGLMSELTTLVGGWLDEPCNNTGSMDLTR